MTAIAAGKGAGTGRRAAAAGLVLAALAVAGCAAGPSYPLYTPRTVAGTFGYSEQPVSQTRFKVTYAAPVRRTYTYGGSRRDRDADYLVSLSYDMALRRAAELTLAGGYQAFKVVERNNDVEINVSYDYYGDPFYYDPYYHRHGHPYYRYPRYPYYPYYNDPFYSPYARLAAEVTLLIEMRHTASNDTFDARTTRDRVVRHYGNAAPPYPVDD